VVPISSSAALRQGSHIKVAIVASCWQRVGDLIGSGFESHTTRTKCERFHALRYNLTVTVGLASNVAGKVTRYISNALLTGLDFSNPFLTEISP